MIVNLIDIPEYTRSCVHQYWKENGWADLCEKFHYISVPGYWIEILSELNNVDIEQIKIDLFPFILNCKDGII